jgi:hypothetical protein
MVTLKCALCPSIIHSCPYNHGYTCQPGLVTCLACQNNGTLLSHVKNIFSLL